MKQRRKEEEEVEGRGSEKRRGARKPHGQFVRGGASSSFLSTRPTDVAVVCEKEKRRRREKFFFPDGGKWRAAVALREGGGGRSPEIWADDNDGGEGRLLAAEVPVGCLFSFPPFLC